MSSSSKVAFTRLPPEPSEWAGLNEVSDHLVKVNSVVDARISLVSKVGFVVMALAGACLAIMPREYTPWVVACMVGVTVGFSSIIVYCLRSLSRARKKVSDSDQRDAFLRSQALQWMKEPYWKPMDFLVNKILDESDYVTEAQLFECAEKADLPDVPMGYIWHRYGMFMPPQRCLEKPAVERGGNGYEKSHSRGQSVSGACSLAFPESHASHGGARVGSAGTARGPRLRPHAHQGNVPVYDELKKVAAQQSWIDALARWC